MSYVINDTTYAGEVASQFIVKSLTGADTIAGGHVYVKDGIKKKFTIPRFDSNYEDLIQDRAATPTSSGSFTVDGKVLEPEDYAIYVEFNPRDFEDHWYTTQQNDNLIDRALPYTVESVMVQEVMKRHSKFLNKLLWNGDKSKTSTKMKYIDGFIAKAMADSDTIDVLSPTTLSAANIIAEFEKGYLLIPAALKYDPQVKFYVSYATYDFYVTAQIAQTYKGVDVTSAGVPKYKGKEVVPVADFPNDVFMIAKGLPTMESNLWVGMNSTADEGLKVAQLQANSELYFVKCLMKLDVQIGWGDETVLYGTI